MERLLPSPSAKARPHQQRLSGSCLSRSCSPPHFADTQTPPCLGEEVAVRSEEGNTEHRGSRLLEFYRQQNEAKAPS